ncbi:hypothetical protein ABKV19_023049 [Rosa sericea]
MKSVIDTTPVASAPTPCIASSTSDTINREVFIQCILKDRMHRKGKAKGRKTLELLVDLVS